MLLMSASARPAMATASGDKLAFGPYRAAILSARLYCKASTYSGGVMMGSSGD